ncbi:MAG TPA: hypothetical protein VNF47_07205 [Streptosporangiaceae bacterium]|nr:hypothetical protein [Streptosporangiaceae bacterium]
MAARDRGQRPQAPTGKLREPARPPGYDDETPKFCLHYLRSDFDVHALSAQGQSAFAKTLQKLSGLRWKQLITAPRHGVGTEFIPASQVKAPIPAPFRDRDRFLVFRYDGLLPMAGVRVEAVFHVLWIEPEFDRLYDHG